MPYSALNWFAITANSRTASSEKPPREVATVVSSLLVPSIRKLLLRLVCPAASTLLLLLPTIATPGDIAARLEKLRPFSGSVSSSVRVMVFDSVLLVVSTSGDCAGDGDRLRHGGELERVVDRGLLSERQDEAACGCSPRSPTSRSRLRRVRVAGPRRGTSRARPTRPRGSSRCRCSRW